MYVKIAQCPNKNYAHIILNSESLKSIKNSDLEHGSCFVILDNDNSSLLNAVLFT